MKPCGSTPSGTTLAFRAAPVLLAFSVAAAVPALAQVGPLEAYVEIARPGEAALYVFENMPLGVEQVAFAEGTTLGAVLEARSVYPDGDAIALIYELNPTLGETEVPAGTTLTLPTLEPSDSVSGALREGFVAYVRPDIELKRSLIRRTAELLEVSGSLADAPPALFGGAAPRAQFVAAVVRVRAFGVAVARSIQERTRPVGRSVLEPIDTGLRLTNEAASTVLMGRVIGEEARATVEAVAEHADLHRDYWVEELGPELAMARFPRSRVSIRVLRGTDLVGGLRVYYVLEAYVREPREVKWLPQLTRADAPLISLPPGLDVADYYIWAGPDGQSDPEAASTNVLPLELRELPDGSNYPVELSFRP